MVLLITLNIIIHNYPRNLLNNSIYDNLNKTIILESNGVDSNYSKKVTLIIVIIFVIILVSIIIVIYTYLKTRKVNKNLISTKNKNNSFNLQNKDSGKLIEKKENKIIIKESDIENLQISTEIPKWRNAIIIDSINDDIQLSEIYKKNNNKRLVINPLLKN
jgi:hypothetical protein